MFDCLFDFRENDPITHCVSAVDSDPFASHALPVDCRSARIVERENLGITVTLASEPIGAALAQPDPMPFAFTPEEWQARICRRNCCAACSNQARDPPQSGTIRH